MIPTVCRSSCHLVRIRSSIVPRIPHEETEAWCQQSYHSMFLKQVLQVLFLARLQVLFPFLSGPGVKKKTYLVSNLDIVLIHTVSSPLLAILCLREGHACSEEHGISVGLWKPHGEGSTRKASKKKNFTCGVTLVALRSSVPKKRHSRRSFKHLWLAVANRFEIIQ